MLLFPSESPVRHALRALPKFDCDAFVTSVSVAKICHSGIYITLCRRIKIYGAPEQGSNLVPLRQLFIKCFSEFIQWIQERLIFYL